MIAPPARDTRLRLTAGQARELAGAYGTPLYVVGEAHFRARLRRYRSAFQAAHPKAELTFASKANSTVALLAIAHQEGFAIDVASEGEFRAALAAGVPAHDCHFHGNNKSREEIAFALDQGIGMMVVDHFGEIETIASLSIADRPEEAPGTLPSDRSTTTKIVIRLAPGVDPLTHAKISTGQADTKFGFNITDGSAERATLRCLELGLPLVGFHCHVGSQLSDPEAQRSGGELIARFAVEMKNRHGFEAKYLNVGGGLGVHYTEGDVPMEVEEYCQLVVQAVSEELAGTELDPVLGQEPGRSLIAESGVTLYRVGPIKTVPAPGRGTRTYVAVDGGYSDNPRPALYGSKYEVERIADHSDPAHSTGHPAPSDRSARFTVSGKHCETDKLFEDVELPTDLQSGDLLQVLCTGAYNSSMANNYNRYPRPATALVREDGSRALIQRRESWDEMLAREIVPEDLRTK